MINVSKLKKGMIIKNYKELCGLLDMRATSGNGKINQLNELKLYCEYHKDGNKFVIDEVYNNPTITTTPPKKYKDVKEFNIEYELKDNYGVYYILQGDNIYIGSTYTTYRQRFIRHNTGAMKHTYNMLKNGGTFNILHDMTGILDKKLIRMVENEYIEYFKNNSYFNLINKRVNNTNKKVVDYKNIKIHKKYIDQVINFCKKNDISFKYKCK